MDDCCMCEAYTVAVHVQRTEFCVIRVLIPHDSAIILQHRSGRTMLKRGEHERFLSARSLPEPPLLLQVLSRMEDEGGRRIMMFGSVGRTDGRTPGSGWRPLVAAVLAAYQSSSVAAAAFQHRRG
jgi:hypothetical protein